MISNQLGKKGPHLFWPYVLQSAFHKKSVAQLGNGSNAYWLNLVTNGQIIWNKCIRNYQNREKKMIFVHICTLFKCPEGTRVALF